MARAAVFSRIWRKTGERQAVTTLEFALSAAVFLGTLTFVSALGFVLYVQVALDFVASRAGRLLAVDTQNMLASNQATFQSGTVCPLLAAFLDCSQVSVALLPVTVYNATNIPVTVPPSFSPGQSGSLMLLQLTYALPDFVHTLGLSQTVARFPYMNE